MRCGTIVFRNADGSPGEAVDFVAGYGGAEHPEFEPADEVVDWLLDEFLEYKKKQAKSKKKKGGKKVEKQGAYKGGA